MVWFQHGMMVAGNKSDRIKLINYELIGKYSWDSINLSVNSGKGVNE